MNKKILILGGNGYIGSRLSNLLEKDYNLTILDLHSPKNLVSSNIKYIKSDISNQTVINKLTDEFYDVVINLISLDYKSDNYEPTKVNKINVLPTWNLLNSFAKNNLKKFINFFYSCLFKFFNRF